MLNSELNSLQDVLVILNNYNNYTTYIEVSPALYVYLRQQVQSINNFNIDELTKENSNKNFDTEDAKQKIENIRKQRELFN